LKKIHTLIRGRHISDDGYVEWFLFFSIYSAMKVAKKIDVQHCYLQTDTIR